MSIESLYRNLLTEEYVKNQLSQGNIITTDDVEDYIEGTLDENDYTVPQFDASSYTVTRDASSSASLFRNTFSNIRQDLKVLYKHLVNLANTNQKTFARWSLEADNLEKKLVDLEERIENLLLLAQDTEGYHSVLIDNFTDTLWIDKDHTTAEIDLDASEVLMSKVASSETTRIFLNNLTTKDDITFKVRTTANFISRVDAVKSSLADIFHQQSKNWWTSVNLKKQEPVTCELGVRLDPDTTVPISRIHIKLHDSVESSPMHITPLYSTDNKTWNQIPSNTYTAEVRRSYTFTFRSVDAQYIKFLLTKTGPDSIDNQNSVSYQFGFKEISFFNQSFSTTTAGTLITEPLSVTHIDSSIKPFEKLTLETCERIEDDTSIDYYIATSNSSIISLDSDSNPTNGQWVPISPIQRTEKLNPYILNVGDIVNTTIGDTEHDTVDSEIVKVSYDGTVAPGASSPSDYVNPASSFALLYKDASSGTISSQSRTSSSTPRYTFANKNERILNYQLKKVDDGVTDSAIKYENLIIFRNVGKRGLTPKDPEGQVRGIQRGWGFDDPYYTCVIEIVNPEGLTINIGDSSMIVDGVKYSNIIDNTVLTGKSGISGDEDYNDGLHTIKVHKNNWKEVTPNLTTLTALKAADPLYPYNHKLLIEGYAYDSTYPSTSEKIYTGVDCFAEYVMDEISIFDLQNNISNDYSKFALDLDAPSSHDGIYSSNEPTTVIVVKIDDENSDFIQERFMLRLNLVNETRKYLRLKAVLSTEDSEISPGLLSYKIKLQ